MKTKRTWLACGLAAAALVLSALPVHAQTLRGSPASVERIYQQAVRHQLEFFANDAYKTKVRTAVGAGQGPTFIYGWGGGVLKSYVDAGQVEDLSTFLKDNPDLADEIELRIKENLGIIQSPGEDGPSLQAVEG